MPIRTKSKGSIYTKATDIQYSRSDGTRTDVVVWSGNYSSGERSYMAGVDLVNFHKRRNKGELLPITPFHQQRVAVGGQGSYYLQYKHNSGLIDTYTNVGNYHGVIDLSESTLLKRAQEYANAVDTDYLVQKAAADLYASGWAAGTFLGELGSTIKMFKTMAARLYRELVYLTKVRSFNFDVFTTAWMETRYGWRPFIGDLVNLSEALQRLGDGKQRYSKTKNRLAIDGGSEIVSVDPWPLSNLEHYADHTWTVSTSTRGKVIADFRPPVINVNPMTTAWELITLSFVVDWFVNVGQMLNALSLEMCTDAYVAAGGKYILMEGYYNTTDTIIHDYSSKGTCIAYSPQVSLWYEVELTIRQPSQIPLSPLAEIRLDDFKIIDLIIIAWNILRNRR